MILLASTATSEMLSSRILARYRAHFCGKEFEGQTPNSELGAVKFKKKPMSASISYAVFLESLSALWP